MDNTTFVWAKMKGYSAWPAKICSSAPVNVPTPKNTTNSKCVYFFGTHNYAWISSQNISDYVQNKFTFSVKNKTALFIEAIKEIEEDIASSGKITLKGVAVDELLATFNDTKTVLQDLFDKRCGKLDRFNYGHGLDFLAILSRTLSENQKTNMFRQICTCFTGSLERYIQNANHENLFWTILLPEWVVRICGTRYNKSREEIIEQIAKDEENSFNANDFSQLDFE